MVASLQQQLAAANGGKAACAGRAVAEGKQVLAARLPRDKENSAEIRPA